MPIGDVHSDAPGSGARYNDGKPDLSLIPLWIIAESFYGREDCETLVAVLHLLGEFQATGRADYLACAIDLLADEWAACAQVFEYGRHKYAAWNWAKGMSWSIPLACAARHVFYLILRDEENDPESGLPHVGHLLCNLVMLRTYVETYPEGNDLPSPALFSKMFDVTDGVARKPGASPVGWWLNDSDVEIADPAPDESGSSEVEDPCRGFVPGDGNNLHDWMDFVDTVHKTMPAPEYEPTRHPGDLDELRAERSGKPWNAEIIAHGSGAGDYGDPIAPRGTP